MQLALEWRQKFKADAVVDIVCYRKFGHNEIDEPMFTQPLMYKVIKKHVSAHQQYAGKLIKEGILTADEVKAKQAEILKELETEFELSKNYVPKFRDWVSSHWSGFKSPDQFASIRKTWRRSENIERSWRENYRNSRNVCAAQNRQARVRCQEENV